MRYSLQRNGKRGDERRELEVGVVIPACRAALNDGIDHRFKADTHDQIDLPLTPDLIEPATASLHIRTKRFLFSET